jgi:hypothetical protein
MQSPKHIIEYSHPGERIELINITRKKAGTLVECYHYMFGRGT